MRAAPAPQPWRLPDLCAAYAWPSGLAGRGVIGIVELDGGWLQSDIDAFFQSINQPSPAIVDVIVGGSGNAPNQHLDKAFVGHEVGDYRYFLAHFETASNFLRDFVISRLGHARDSVNHAALIQTDGHRDLTPSGRGIRQNLRRRASSLSD